MMVIVTVKITLAVLLYQLSRLVRSVGKTLEVNTKITPSGSRRTPKGEGGHKRGKWEGKVNQ